MNEHVEELLETLDAILRDLNAAGCHFVAAVVDSQVEDLRMWRTTNPLITHQLADLLERNSYNDLCKLGDYYDES